MNHKFFMNEALILAKKAYFENEVPIGTIIVYENEIIAKAYNMPISTNNPVAHAEILALEKAGKFLNNYRLNNCIVYTTLEPCFMCYGALVHSRIKQLVFGAYGDKYGTLEDKNNFGKFFLRNHNFEIIGGILEDESKKLLKDFFINKRKVK